MPHRGAVGVPGHIYFRLCEWGLGFGGTGFLGVWRGVSLPLTGSKSLKSMEGWPVWWGQLIWPRPAFSRLWRKEAATLVEERKKREEWTSWRGVMAPPRERMMRRWRSKSGS